MPDFGAVQTGVAEVISDNWNPLRWKKTFRREDGRVLVQQRNPIDVQYGWTT